MGDRTGAARWARAVATVLGTLLVVVTSWIAADAEARAADFEVDALEPASGPTEGGTVTVTGSGFVDGHTLVWWDGVELTPASTTPTTIEVVVPPHAPGDVAVTVQVAEGFSPVLVYRYLEDRPDDPEPTATVTARSPSATPTPVPEDPPSTDRPVREPEPSPEPTPERLADTGRAARTVPVAAVGGALVLVGAALLAGGRVRG